MSRLVKEPCERLSTSRPMLATAVNNMRRRLSLAAFSVFLFVSVARPAFAQPNSCSVSAGSCTVAPSSNSATLTVGRFTHLQVANTSLALNGTVANVRASDYVTGFVNSSPVSMTVWSTAAWAIKVSGTSNSAKLIGSYSFAGNTANVCPATAAYLAMSGTATTATGFVGTTTSTPNSGVTGYLCVRTALSWTLDPASAAIAPSVFVTVSSP